MSWWEKGCLETEVSGSALRRRVVEMIEGGASSLLSKKITKGETLSLDDIIKTVSKEDVLCIDLMKI